MKFVPLLSLFSLLWALGACSNDESLSTEERVPICLTASNIGVETRVTGNVQNTQIAEGEKVYAWVDAVDGEANYIKAWALTATDTESSENSGNYNLTGTTQYYPLNHRNINLYAVHGNFTEAITEGTTERPTTLTHTVETNQSSSANYQKSDLLYVASSNITFGTNPVSLTFSHLLSRIVIRLKQDNTRIRFNEEEKLKNSTLTIEGTMYHQGTLSVSDGSFTINNTATTNALTVASGENLLFYNSESESTTQYCAILPPQRLANGKITITTSTGSTASGTIPTLTMASGTAYVLTVTLTDLTLTVDTEKYTEQW